MSSAYEYIAFTLELLLRQRRDQSSSNNGDLNTSDGGGWESPLHLHGSASDFILYCSSCLFFGGRLKSKKAVPLTPCSDKCVGGSINLINFFFNTMAIWTLNAVHLNTNLTVGEAVYVSEVQSKLFVHRSTPLTFDDGYFAEVYSRMGAWTLRLINCL